MDTDEIEAEQCSGFKCSVREALERGTEAEAIRALVREYYASGGTQAEAYESLQNIWLEYRYDQIEESESDPKRNVLEFVMERVWYWGD